MPPGSSAPSASPTTNTTVAGHERPCDRTEDRADQQHGPRHRRHQQAVEPALLDVAREVRAGRGPGEAGALEARQRHDPGQVGVCREAVEPGEAAELPGHAEQEHDRRDRGRQQGAAHP